MTFEWVDLGRHARALADGERIVGVLYWQPAGPAERDGPGGEPGVLDAAFFYVNAGSLSRHKHVMDGPGDKEAEWDLAMEHVGVFLQWSESVEAAPEPIARLMRRLEDLDVEEGRVLYDTLSPEDRAALDDRGLVNVWRTMDAIASAGETAGRVMGGRLRP